MSKLINITGQRFGFWIAKRRVENAINGQTKWECLCECGILKNVTTNSLRSGNSTSCGCNNVPNLINMIFGYLLVISLDLDRKKSSKRYWSCKCDCGNVISVNTTNLCEKIITSCGCNGVYKTKQLIAKNKILISTASKLTSENLAIIAEQTRIITSFNEEIQKSLKLLEKINKLDF
jgi:hypothetical protein